MPNANNNTINNRPTPSHHAAEKQTEAQMPQQFMCIPELTLHTTLIRQGNPPKIRAHEWP
jgi:hypothetical protein